MSVNIYATSSTDGLEPEEVKLFNLINEYRSQNGLPALRLSKALTTVANRHTIDLAENVKTLTHSWSDATYDASNPSTYSTMWQAPQRLNTNYPGNGYENAFGTSDNGYLATAEEALNSWKNSPVHNQVILNQNIWTNKTWNALGVGIYKGYASLWFGEEADPTGSPYITNSNNSGNYNLLGTMGDDLVNLTVGALANYPDGYAALDGNDTIIGSSDGELIMGNRGQDSLVGGSGNDILIGGKDIDKIDGGIGNDLMKGDQETDTLIGGEGADTAYGGKGNDLLLGGLGDDLLVGDLGNDTMTGDGGNDTFVVSNSGELDIITDYGNGDLIKLPQGLKLADISLDSSGNGQNILLTVKSTGLQLAQLNNFSGTVMFLEG
jgi:Ca2+-binding RTX toxin-like protein